MSNFHRKATNISTQDMNYGKTWGAGVSQQTSHGQSASQLQGLDQWGSTTSLLTGGECTVATAPSRRFHQQQYAHVLTPAGIRRAKAVERRPVSPLRSVNGYQGIWEDDTASAPTATVPPPPGPFVAARQTSSPVFASRASAWHWPQSSAQEWLPFQEGTSGGGQDEHLPPSFVCPTTSDAAPDGPGARPQPASPCAPTSARHFCSPVAPSTAYTKPSKEPTKAVPSVSKATGP
ncbi:hypothetical protein AURANDRAFT_62833 [Aureococcus anophagefferens]|uniref:Uncharacterized protein n=1 Tax=Aureococcus anophagefferens TaxID=44056 RepID=F0Y386_AURAN|nr:hypothetical protein AURANDRAFT_62833 [Aureococcus anophagefferens]EGB10217.1 hypothetical protein AURANDRAFT_62833 [Aureococcus anophagefferens]|eukprot:XP_009035036.1 hypothetical protein AURANDRAFT_62833 [Aureococcus anophagefferens]